MEFLNYLNLTHATLTSNLHDNKRDIGVNFLRGLEGANSQFVHVWAAFLLAAYFMRALKLDGYI